MDSLEDESQIERQLKNYCRAMDRCDPELGPQVFFADATVDYGAMFQGTGHGSSIFRCERTVASTAISIE